MMRGLKIVFYVGKLGFFTGTRMTRMTEFGIQILKRGKTI